MPKRKLTLAQKKELDKLNGTVRMEKDEVDDDDDDDDDDEPGEVKELPELVKPSFKPLSATEASGETLIPRSFTNKYCVYNCCFVLYL